MVTVPPKDPAPPATQFVGSNLSTLSWNQLLDLLISDAIAGVPAAKDQYPLVWDNVNQKYDLAPGFTRLIASVASSPIYQRKTLWLAPGTNINFAVTDSGASDSTKVTINAPAPSSTRGFTHSLFGPTTPTTWAGFVASAVVGNELFNSPNYENWVDLGNLQNNQMNMFANIPTIVTGFSAAASLKLQYSTGGAWTDSGAGIDIDGTATSFITANLIGSLYVINNAISVPAGMRTKVALRLLLNTGGGGADGAPDPIFTSIGVLFS